jgi:hypothetical protein
MRKGRASSEFKRTVDWQVLGPAFLSSTALIRSTPTGLRAFDRWTTRDAEVSHSRRDASVSALLQWNGPGSLLQGLHGILISLSVWYQHGQPSCAMNQTPPCHPDPSVTFSAGLCLSIPHRVASRPLVSAPRDSCSRPCLGQQRPSHQPHRGPFSASTYGHLPCL